MLNILRFFVCIIIAKKYNKISLLTFNVWSRSLEEGIVDTGVNAK